MVGDFSRAIVTIHNFHSLQDLPAMEPCQKDDCMIHKCMDCINRETSTKSPCKKEHKCGTVCPVCFKLCLSFINIIKICTNCSTNVPNTWLIANNLGQLTCINGRRFQSCNSNNSQFSLFQDLPAMEPCQKDDCMIHKCMDCIKRETSTKSPCKKEHKCGTVCPVCFKLCLSFINIIKICTNCSTNVPNTCLIANKLGQLTCINGRRFQSCNSNNSQFSLFTGSTTKDALWSQRVCFSSSHSKDVERDFEVMLYGPPGSATAASCPCPSVVVSVFDDQRVIIINGDKQLLTTEVRESIEK